MTKLLADYVIPHSKTDLSRIFRIGHIHKETNYSYMFVQGKELSSVRLDVCTGTRTVCSTVTLQRYMFVQGLELSAVR